jgi:hypothetical protein
MHPPRARCRICHRPHSGPACRAGWRGQFHRHRRHDHAAGARFDREKQLTRRDDAAQFCRSAGDHARTGRADHVEARVGLCQRRCGAGGGERICSGSGFGACRVPLCFGHRTACHQRIGAVRGGGAFASQCFGAADVAFRLHHAQRSRATVDHGQNLSRLDPVADLRLDGDDPAAIDGACLERRDRLDDARDAICGGSVRADRLCGDIDRRGGGRWLFAGKNAGREADGGQQDCPAAQIDGRTLFQFGCQLRDTGLHR